MDGKADSPTVNPESHRKDGREGSKKTAASAVEKAVKIESASRIFLCTAMIGRIHDNQKSRMS
jgi:hypothetical protein